MSVFLVITVIGDDQPGLVEQLSTTISGHGGNWLESSMSHLAGKFAGILKVAVPAARAEELKAALGSLAQLKVMAETAIDLPKRGPTRRFAPARCACALARPDNRWHANRNRPVRCKW